MKVECINDSGHAGGKPEVVKGETYNVIKEGKCKCGIAFYELDVKSSYEYVTCNCGNCMAIVNVVAVKYRFVIIDKPAFKKITYTEVLQLVEVSEN